MRRLLAITLGLLGLGTFTVFSTGAGESSDAYLVRAEFRNAFSIIEGEDVKVAGVKVGSIKSLDVTEAQTAAVVLQIDEPGFDDWRADAECTIRPQSLIGEKFIECLPTQPRPQGAQPAAPLKTAEVDGETMALLPVDRTRRPVDIDLVGNILRLPYRERLTILLNEFGAGIAGRGKDLKTIIRNADPGLKATDEVLDLLADQNKVLRRLAVDADTVLGPLANDRERVASFIEQANTVAGATAERSSDLEAGIKRLPRFLRELRPTMTRLGALSDQATPVLGDLNSVAPDLARFIGELGPFSSEATPALDSLGEATKVGRVALNKSRPILRDLRTFGATSKVLATDLRELTESFRDTGGIERLMDYVFFQVAAINGFDQYGHYLRAQLLVNLCSTYTTTGDASCAAKFAPAEATSRSAKAALSDTERSPALARQDAVLRGMSPEEALGRSSEGSSSRTPPGGDAEPADAIALPEQLLPSPTSPGQPGPTKLDPTPAPTGGSPGTGPTGTTALLDYLLGSGS